MLNKTTDGALRAKAKLVAQHASKEERQAVAAYKGEDVYDPINTALREGRPLQGHLADVSRRIDQIIARAQPLNEPALVYRGIGLEKSAGEKLLADFARAAKTGEAVNFPAYTSTTTDPENAEGFGNVGDDMFTFEIAARHGLYVANDFTHEYAAENEFLLPRNSKFRVGGIREVKQRGLPNLGIPDSTRKVIQLEQLP